MSNYRINFNNYIIDKSVSNDINVALTEWEFLRVDVCKKNEIKSCVCKKCPIKTVFTIINKINNDIIRTVGSDCFQRIGEKNKNIMEEYTRFNHLKKINYYKKLKDNKNPNDIKDTLISTYCLSCYENLTNKFKYRINDKVHLCCDCGYRRNGYKHYSAKPYLQDIIRINGFNNIKNLMLYITNEKTLINIKRDFLNKNSYLDLIKKTKNDCKNLRNFRKIIIKKMIYTKIYYKMLKIKEFVDSHDYFIIDWGKYKSLSFKILFDDYNSYCNWFYNNDFSNAKPLYATFKKYIKNRRLIDDFNRLYGIYFTTI